MLGLGIKATKGEQPDTPRYVDRLARVLSEYPAPVSESAATVAPGDVEQEGWEGHMAENSESQPAEAPDSGGGVPSKAQPEALDRELGEQPNLNGRSLEEASNRIAEALTWTLTRAVKQAHDRAEQDRTRIAAGLNVVELLSGDVRHVSNELAGLRSEAQSVAQRDSEIRSTLAMLDDRSRQGEADLQSTRDQISELLKSRSESDEQAGHLASRLASLEAQVKTFNQVIQGLDKSLQSHVQAAGGLTSLCENLVQANSSLQDQLAEQALAMEQLRADTAHRGSLVDNLIGSLRGLDGRTEDRQMVDRDVKVVMVGQAEAAISGRIVDASDSGLGMRLAAALPVGSQIRLDVGGTSLVGEVAHCRRRGAWYNAGLKSVRLSEEGVSENNGVTCPPATDSLAQRVATEANLEMP